MKRCRAAAHYLSEGAVAMDHDVVVRQKITERYLLDELDPQARDEFEEHFFECPVCAIDVRAGALLAEQSKLVFAEEAARAQTRFPQRTEMSAVGRQPGWLEGLQALFRPVFALPAMALMLFIIGYQNLVTYPHLQQAANRPQVLPWASVNVGTYGSEGPVVTTSPGQSFLLFVRIPPEKTYSSYTAQLYNPAGKMEWTLAIPVAASQPPATSSYSQDQWPVQVPGANWVNGTYKLTVRGTTAAGETKEVGIASFELQVEK